MDMVDTRMVLIILLMEVDIIKVMAVKVVMEDIIVEVVITVEGILNNS